MKKVFALVLTVTFVLGLSACSHQSNDTPNSDPNGTIERTGEPEVYPPANISGVELDETDELSDVAQPNLNMATLKDLIERNGENLTWEDFNSYYSEEIGSGLYILRYPIDTDYFLLIGGGSLESSPMYIRLVSEADTDRYIDVRYEDIGEFISGSSIIPSLAYEKDAAQHKNGDPGVNPHKFVNVSIHPIDSQDTAL